MPGLAIGGPAPSNGSPEACASRWRIVEPGRAGRVVQVDDALLGRDEARERGHQLRHRGEPVDVLAVAARVELAVRPEHRHRGVRHVPAVDLAQGVHAVDTRDVERRIVPAVSPMAATVGYSPGRPRRQRRLDRRDGAGHARRRASRPADPYGQARRCLEIVVDALAELGAGPEHVVRTRVYLTRADDWPEVGRAHGEVFGESLPASSMLVISGLLDPRWLVEIEADAIIA